MLLIRQVGIILAGFLFCIEFSLGQSVMVNSITVTGIVRTKPSIVYRELTFAEGDSLLQNDLGPILERNRNNLLNLGIFNEAVVNISEWDTRKDRIDITVEVKESWYIYVLPILDLADRNFNVWWTTYNHSFDRINIGARLEWLNFSGRNDKLKAKVQFGYTPKQEIEYRFPYLNKKQSIGLSVGFLHSVNKEVNYGTLDNQQLFVQLDERSIQERWQARASAQFRPSFFIKYELDLAYQHLKVDEEVVQEYNPSYFRNGEDTHEAFSALFSFEYDDRDIKLFPARGMKVLLETEKVGLGMNEDEDILKSILSVEWNTTTGRFFQHRISTIGQYSFTRSMPSFIYYEGLGRSVKYVSGYELYLMDGLDYFLGKYQLAYKLLEKKTHLGTAMPLEPFRQMPFSIYISMLAEAGYVNDPYTGDQNPFSNRWLYGGGPAVSVMLYNNFLVQFSYTVNHVGEWGFYIHNRTSF